MKQSVFAFEALGHESRLAIVRLLIPAGQDGVPAGTIADALDLPPNRLSFHLSRLSAAGLIQSRRHGRHLYYAIRYVALGNLVRFLVEDCCANAPAGCLPGCPSAISTSPCQAPAQEDNQHKEDKDAVS